MANQSFHADRRRVKVLLRDWVLFHEDIPKYVASESGGGSGFGPRAPDIDVARAYMDRGSEPWDLLSDEEQFILREQFQDVGATFDLLEHVLAEDMPTALERVIEFYIMSPTTWYEQQDRFKAALEVLTQMARKRLPHIARSGRVINSIEAPQYGGETPDPQEVVSEYRWYRDVIGYGKMEAYAAVAQATGLGESTVRKYLRS